MSRLYTAFGTVAKGSGQGGDEEGASRRALYKTGEICQGGRRSDRGVMGMAEMKAAAKVLPAVARRPSRCRFTNPAPS